jgi:hypothetical protein
VGVKEGGDDVSGGFIAGVILGLFAGASFQRWAIARRLWRAAVAAVPGHRKTAFDQGKTALIWGLVVVVAAVAALKSGGGS